MLERVRELDLQFLLKTGRGDATGAYDAVASHNDSTRICGLASIVTMLELLGPSNDQQSALQRGRLLKYDQWKDARDAGAVTFASVALYRDK